jgi:TonB family protein
MFDTLLASRLGPLSWKRPALLAIALHAGAVAAVTGGAAPHELSLPRDTIRLDLRLAQAFVPPLHRPDRLPAPDGLPPPADIPRIRLDRPVLDLGALTTVPSASQPSAHPGLSSRPTLPSGGELHLGDSIFSPADVDRGPELAAEVRPRYPETLRGSGFYGVVELEYVVSANGRVDEETMDVRTSPHPAFTKAAVDALLAARFRPALRNGRPVAVRVRQSVRFVRRVCLPNRRVGIT